MYQNLYYLNPKISFIVSKLLCRKEVNTNGLFLKVIEELQNILVFSVKFIKVLKGETTIVPERRVTLNINDKLQFLNESNTTISPDKLKIKVNHGIFKLCRKEVNTNGLFLKVIEELQNILVFRMESMSLHN
jgi:hypothetical protein